MDILDYVLLPHIHVLHMVFAFFPFVITNYISYLSSSMLTFIALNDYITRRLILTTIILLYNSSATTLRASSFWPRFFLAYIQPICFGLQCGYAIQLNYWLFLWLVSLHKHIRSARPSHLIICHTWFLTIISFTIVFLSIITSHRYQILLLYVYNLYQRSTYILRYHESW